MENNNLQKITVDIYDTLDIVSNEFFIEHSSIFNPFFL